MVKFFDNVFVNMDDKIMYKYEELLSLTYDFYKNKGVPLRFLPYNKYDIDAGGGKPRISYGVVKAVWNLCYVYYVFYDCFVKGISALTPYLKIRRNLHIHSFLLSRRKQIIEYLKDSEYTVIDDSVNPTSQIYVEENDREERKYLNDEFFEEISKEIKQKWANYGISEYIRYRNQNPITSKLEYCWKVNKITSYALLFLMFHEYSHTQYKGKKAKTPLECSIEGIPYDKKKNERLARKEETFCDKNAAKIFTNDYLEKLINDEKIAAEIGMQMAILFLGFCSIATKNYGGIDHPKIYQRLISVFRVIIDKDDKAWCMLIGALSLEFHYLNIKITHKDTFDTFEHASYDYVKRLKAYVRRKEK